MDTFQVVLIDDDETQLDYFKLLFESLEDSGLILHQTTSVESALEMVESKNINLLLTDYVMPEMNGMGVLKAVKKANPLVDVVVITGYADTNSAVEVMKEGAYDYLIKPVKPEILENLVKRVKEKQQLVKENQVLREEIETHFASSSIISKSRAMDGVLQTIGRSAKSNVNVLIHGESGTGKELIARAIHSSSLRSEKPFITINVSALSEGLIESELFGHKKGSFTGADKDHVGRFQRANKGTLFIDEVGDIPPSIQVKLLRAIQFGQIEPIGSSESLEVDVRVITATSRDIEQMIEGGSFRLDFYYRINVVTIEVPPLRERKEDIPLLVDTFIPQFVREHHRNVKGITRNALDLLMKYEYPGNVRELENILQRAIVLCDCDYIDVSHLPPLLQNGDQAQDEILDPLSLTGSYEDKMTTYEKMLLIQALRSADYNKSAAARALGIGERRLRYRMEKLGVTEELSGE